MYPEPTVGAVILNEVESQGYLWAGLDEIDDLNLEPFTKNLINEYKKGERSGFLRDVMGYGLQVVNFLLSRLHMS